MTSVNVTTTKNTVTVNGETRVVTVKTVGPQGAQGVLQTGDLGDITVTTSGSGTQSVAINTGAVTSSKILDGTIATGDIADDAITSAKIANAAVTTNEIQNLTIINNDISNSAAIAGTKISPDFGSQNIVTTGTLGVTGLTTTGDLKISDNSPVLNFTDTNATADNQRWDIKCSGSDELLIQAINDSGGGGGNLFKFTRNGNSIQTFQGQRSGATWLTVDNINKKVTTRDLDVTNNITVTGTVDGVDIAARDTLFGALTSSSGVLTNGVTATTQSASDNSTKVATTAYVDNAVSSGGGGSASQLTDTNGTVKVEVDTSTIFLKDTVHIRDSLPTIHFKSSDGNTNYGWFRSFSASTEIFNRVSGGETKFKVQAGSSTINKILIRNTSGGTQTNPDVCIGRSMVTTGKPTDLNAFFPHTGGVELYHISGSTGTKKFETTANGITVQGSVTTEDINMSNLNASANEVDNTKGSWTIQEGASDLFLINRVNGKKYKFNLTEIS